MFDWIRRLVLQVVRLPAEPTPPIGAPGSVRIFRAAKNYYLLRVAAWIFAQCSAIIGIVFSLWLLNHLTEDVNAIWAPPAAHHVSASARQGPEPTNGKQAQLHKDLDPLARKIARWPKWTLRLIHLAEYAAIALFIVQLPVTFAAVRLEYEQHWYIVTDRSLRIRTGLFSVQESTMSFANLQQVEMHQGPLQRLLGIADVRVQSAGGSDASPHGKGQDSMHRAVFHGVANATEIRDLILARLQRFRESGLGDPDDQHAPCDSNATLLAAQDLLHEVRALRQVWSA